jgi:4-amino-4-deoxy-L-arabinose transferase-like glycosyltransferase
MTKHQRFIERTLLNLIILIGFFIRIYQLDKHSFWLDEGLTAYVALLSPKGIITYTATTSFEHPPLYFLLAHFWQALIGVDNEWTWRFLSVFWGTLTIPTAYLLFKKLMGWRVALLGILLLAFNPYYIGYARETRMYAFLGVVGILSTYLLIRTISDNSRWMTAGYIITVFIGVFTHYMFALLVIAHFLFLGYSFLRDRHNKKILRHLIVYSIIYVIAGGILLIWIKTGSGTSSTLSSLSSRNWTLQHLWKFWIHGKIRYFLFTFAVTEPRFRLSKTEINFIYSYWLIIGWGFLTYLWTTKHQAKQRVIRSIPLILLLILTPFSIVFFIPRGTPPRFFIDIAAIFLLLLASGLAVLYKRNITKPFILLMMLPVVATVFIGFREIYATPTSDFRDATNFIKDNTTNGDLVLFTHPWGVGLVKYYLHDTPVDIDVFPKKPEQPNGDKTEEFLSSVFNDYDRLWLGPVDPGTADKQGVIDLWLAMNAFQITKNWFPNSTYVSLYLSPEDKSSFTCTKFTNQDFGGIIALNQACIDSVTAQPSSGLRLALEWTIETKPQDDLVAVVELLDQNGKMWFKRVSPLQGGYLPSSSWQEGMTINDHHGIWVSSDVPSGQYSVELGIYNTTTGKHLSLGDRDFLSVFKVQITD